MNALIVGIASKQRGTGALRMWSRLRLPCLLAFLVASATSASAQGFKVTDLGSVGGDQSFASAVNNRGEVLGGWSWSTDVLGNSYSFLYSRRGAINAYLLPDTTASAALNDRGQIAGALPTGPGTAIAATYDRAVGVVVLGTLGGRMSMARAINNAGQVAGWSYLPGTFVSHAFLYSDGVMTDIGLIGRDSYASGINDSGTVVGAFLDSEGSVTQHAFVYRDGVMSAINPFNQPDNLSHALGINNNGLIIGQARVGDVWHGFIYSDECATDVAPMDDCLTDLGEYLPASINNNGDVVGYSQVTGRAFLYSNGTIQDLTSRLPRNSGWQLLVALDINDHGQIAGYAMRNGKVSAVLLTPR